MTERVQVDPSEIKIGDLIEAVYTPGYYQSNESVTYRSVVTGTAFESIETTRFSFVKTDSAYTFYLLPKPAPEEPKGLGAVVEDADGDLWVKMTERWRTEDGDTNSTWDMLLEIYGPVTVKSDGYVG